MHMRGDNGRIKVEANVRIIIIRTIRNIKDQITNKIVGMSEITDKVIGEIISRRVL